MMRFHPLSKRGAGGLLAALLCLCPISAAHAQTTLQGTDWSDPNDWSSFAVPTSSDDVLVDGSFSPSYIYSNIATANLTISNSAFVNIVNGNTLTVTGNLTDNGTISLNANAGLDNVLSVSGGTVSGTGTIILYSGGAGAQLSGTLTQSAGHTISGNGIINAALTNNGTVNADGGSGYAGNALIMQTNNMTNNSLIEVTKSVGTGELDINGITLTQVTNGEVLLDGGNVVLENGAEISGGALDTTTNGGVVTVDSNCTLDSLTTNSTIEVGNGCMLTLSGDLTDNGTISVNFQYLANTTLSANGATISGTGTIALSYGTYLNGALTQGPGHTISGNGIVNAALTNNGTVNANAGGASYSTTLLLQTSSMTNNNIMEATNGGTLEIGGITITQGTNGQFLADGGTVQFDTGTGISGGALNTGTNGGVFNLWGNTTFDSVTNNSTVYVNNNDTLTITGDLTNNGSIIANTNGYGIDVISVSGGTISGTGSIVLDDASTHAQLSGTLTQSAGHTITGNGIINAVLTNNGTVNANGGSGNNGVTLALETNNITNNNVMEATNSGVLEISGITVTQGTNGQILANGGTVQFDNGTTISGGALNTGTNGGTYNVYGNTTFDSLTNNSTVYVNNNDTLTITGDLTDNGAISVNSGHYGVDIVTVSGGTVSGTGSFILNAGGGYAQLDGTLTQSAGHTISGYGQINAALTNNGTVNANVSGQTLTLETNSMVNNSLMEATNGGLLEIGAIIVTQGINGELLADGGNVQFDNGSAISGGALNTGTNGGYNTVEGNVTFDSLTNNSTVYKADMGTLTITGDLVDNGSIVVNTDHYGGDAISVSGGTLSGTGSIILNAGGGYAVLEGTLTQSAGHTISGYGQINAALTNNGTVNANVSGQTLSVNGATTNNNLIEASNGGTLSFASGVLSNFSGGTLTGGSYEADDNSTIYLPGSITTNAATVTLSGANSSFSAINSLADNQGTFNLQNGRNFATAGDLVNTGQVNIDSASSLTVSGTLSEPNQGHLIDNGTLTGNVTVGSGSAIGGGGTVIGAITVGQGGSTYPGDPQILTANSVEYMDGSTAQFAIDTTTCHAPVAGSDYDQIQLTGTAATLLQVDPGTTTLQLNLTASSLAALQSNANNPITDVYDLFALGNSGTYSGEFTDLTLTEGGNSYTELITGGDATFLQFGLEFDLSYSLVDPLTAGNDVGFSVFAVPEPSNWAPLVTPFTLLMMYLRGRKRNKVAEMVSSPS